MTRALRHALFAATAAAALTLAVPALSQQAPAPSAAPAVTAFVDVDEAACLATPTGACLAELALRAGRDEPEGWAITAAFEAFIAGDIDLAQRDKWMSRYEAWASSTTLDGIRDRIVPVRAEHLARKGDFAGAYREFGLDRDRGDAQSEPSVLILDEARAGRIKDALARVDRLVESDSRDEIRVEILELALSRSPGDADAVAATVRDRFARRIVQALQAGARGDLAIGRSIEEWARGARSNQTAPFDDPESARRETWDAFLRGAIATNSLAAFRDGLKSRPPFTTSADAESATRLLRPLMREGRAEWIAAIGPLLKLPADETLSLDEEVAPMRLLPVDKILAVAATASTAGAARLPLIDIIVEMLASRGEVDAARELFTNAGRLDDLNRAPAYDQERVAVVFEALWRAVVGKGPQPTIDAMAARVTSPGAKAYVARVETMRTKLAAILAGNKGDEPADDEWAIIMELALGSGDLSTMAKVAAAMKDPGLRTTAFVQIVRGIWERPQR
ncbi:MAG: hypothetical protein WCH83_14360 [Alphaproteobacteria bacterium]